MKTTTHFLGIIAVACLMTACSKTEVNNLEPNIPAAQHKDAAVLPADGIEGSNKQTLTMVRVFCRWHAFTVLLNRAIDEPGNISAPEKREPNEFYVYDEESASKYLPIASAMADPGSYMLWRGFKIEFNPGFTPKQFYSRDEVMDAAQAMNPSITLTPTGVVYEGRKFNALEGKPIRQSLGAVQ